ncbi:MAG: hypothetical protein K8T10_00240 [Candidatus Eremiobacteraeota bacterium]|nr:hypothetical protein [Candidatus Eremiobacteraeota bacterium]
MWKKICSSIFGIKKTKDLLQIIFEFSIIKTVLQKVEKQAARKVGIAKQASFYALGHSFAANLLQPIYCSQSIRSRT